MPMKLFFWDCGGATSHIIQAKDEGAAYDKAIEMRMEWTGEDEETCHGWFTKNDRLVELMSDAVLTTDGKERLLVVTDVKG